jgi:hypothetical protein
VSILLNPLKLNTEQRELGKDFCNLLLFIVPPGGALQI